jgi:hypothetical protein
MLREGKITTAVSAAKQMENRWIIAQSDMRRCLNRIKTEWRLGDSGRFPVREARTTFNLLIAKSNKKEQSRYPKKKVCRDRNKKSQKTYVTISLTAI